MDINLTIPKEIIKEFMKNLMKEKDDNGDRKYNDEEIIEIVKRFEMTFKENNIKFIKQN